MKLRMPSRIKKKERRWSKGGIEDGQLEGRWARVDGQESGTGMPFSERQLAFSMQGNKPSCLHPSPQCLQLLWFPGCIGECKRKAVTYRRYVSGWRGFGMLALLQLQIPRSKPKRGCHRAQDRALRFGAPARGRERRLSSP